MFGGIIIELFKKFERGIVIALAGLLAATILFSTLQLASPPGLLPEMAELPDIFGLFLLVLLGIKLLKTMKAYLRENVVNVEVVLNGGYYRQRAEGRHPGHQGTAGPRLARLGGAGFRLHAHKDLLPQLRRSAGGP